MAPRETDIKVSLLTTCHNDMHSIREHIDSILPELDEETEWICVDAHSDDGSWECLERAAKSEPNMELIQIVQGGGRRLNRGEGRNIAAEFSHGELLIHAVDCDVEYRRGWVKLVAKEFARGHGIPVAGDCYFAISRDEFFRFGRYPEVQREEDMQYYAKLKAAGRFRTRRLNIWAMDRQTNFPKRNLAKMGTDEDRTEAIR